MLLDDLVAVIETLKERIDHHGASLRGNEIRTRMALIDPLLCALGWETYDPGAVMPEYDLSGKNPDYALLGGNGSPVAFIEAKHLGEPLTRHETQLFTYAVMQRVKYAALTDGERWNIFNVYGETEEDQHLSQISISRDSSLEIALKLLLLWRRNLESGQPVAANTPVLVQTDVQNTRSSDSLNQSDLGDWTPLSKFEAVNGKKPPAEIRFSSEESFPIRYWWEVLSGVAEKLAKDGKLTVADCPITGMGFINSSTPNTSRRSKAISGGLFVDVNWNARNIIRHSRKLLSHFGVNPETVELRFE